MQLVTAASPKLISAMLPLTISHIDRIANETVQRAQSSLDKFESLSKLLLEIIWLGHETNTVNDDIILKLEEQFNATVLKRKELQHLTDTMQLRYNDARKELEEARAHHAAAVQSRFFWFFIPVIFTVRITFGCIFFCPPRRDYAAELKLQRAQEALDRLKKAEGKHDDLYHEITKHQDDLTRTMFELASIDLKIASPREIQQVLVKALNQTSYLHSQWSQLTLFFTKLAEDTRSTAQVTTSEFIKRINIVPELEKSDRDFFVPVIAETVQLIERDAHLLYMAAKLYYDVSNEYMMEQIAGVSKFLVLQTDEQREHHLALLHNMTLINSVKVKKLAEKRNQLYHIRTAQRQIEYKEFINHYQPEVIAA
jgi:hypothetical protein